MMPRKNIGRRDFTRLAVPLLAASALPGLVVSGISCEGSELRIPAEMAKSVANLARSIIENLGDATARTIRRGIMESLQNRSMNFATLRAEISELIAWDFDNNNVHAVNGIVMAKTEIAVVLELDRIA